MRSMDEIHEYVASRTRQTREDKRLTPEAKQASIARAWAHANRAAAKIRQEEEKTRASRVRELRRKAFVGADVGTATPNEMISRRDASDRLATVNDPGEALDMLRRATEYGDEHLAGAIAQRAYERQLTMRHLTSGKKNAQVGPSWAPVLNAYASQRPAAAEAIAELSQLAETGAPSSLGRIFHTAIRYTVPKPSEIADLSDEQIQSLATGDL